MILAAGGGLFDHPFLDAAGRVGELDLESHGGVAEFTHLRPIVSDPLGALGLRGFQNPPSTITRPTGAGRSG